MQRQVWTIIPNKIPQRPLQSAEYLCPPVMNAAYRNPAYRSIRLYNGAEMAYTDTGGEGLPVLLFVHGLGTFGGSWLRNTEELRRRYRCIAVDLPGNGYSDRRPHPWSMRFFARCIVDFIGRMELGNVCLVGHSMGGQIAMTALLEAPGCAQRLILCAPAGFERFSEMEKWMYRSSMHFADWLSSDEDSLRRSIRSSFYHYPNQADSLIKELVGILHSHSGSQHKAMIEACIRGMLAEPVWARLRELKLPVLVLFGEQDAFIPNRLLHPVSTRQIAEEGLRQLPAAKLFMLPHCGHFLQWEKAGEVNRIIGNWLKRI